MLSIALLIGRLLAEPNTALPADVTDRGVLFIKRQAIVDPCATPDAGTGDAGTGDAGTGDAGTGDAGTDASMDDAGVPDAGVPDGGTCDLVSLETITMVVQPELGALSADGRFALLYVTPARPMVATQNDDVFGDLARATAPMIEIEDVYIEDASLGQQCSAGCSGGGAQQQESGGCGGGYESSSWDPPGIAPEDDDGGTGIETVGPYEIVRAQPADAQQLEDWLGQLGYVYKQADLDAVTPYLALGYHVVAVRVRASRSLGRRMTPLAFTWEGTEIRVPSALGRTPQATATPLTVYIAGDSRYELPGAIVNFAMRTYGEENAFLTRNDITLDTSLPPSADPIAAGNGGGQYRATKIVTNEIRVPVSVHCEDDSYGLCSDCSAGTKRRQIDFGTIAVAIALALRPRRRRTRSPGA